MSRTRLALWSKNLLDADKTLEWILRACAEAGPEKCALHEPTADKIHARILRLFAKLKESPVPVFLPEHTWATRSALIDYKIAKGALFLAMYGPYGRDILGARWIATALRDLENDNGETLWRLFGRLVERFQCECPIPGQPLPPDVTTPDAQNAIICGDGDEVRDTVEDLKKHLEMLAETSEFADMIAPLRGSCV